MTDDGELTVGDWAFTMSGIGQVVDVRPRYYEGWERIPDGKSAGEHALTSVTAKLAFDFDGKPRSRLRWESCTATACGPLTKKMQKKVDTALRKDAAFAARVEAYQIKNWASIDNLACEANPDQGQRIHAVLERHADAIAAGVTFAQVRDLLAREADFELRRAESRTGITLQLCVRLDSPPEPPRVFRSARILGLDES